MNYYFVTSVFLTAVILVVTADTDQTRYEYFLEKWHDDVVRELIHVVSLPQIPERYLVGQNKFRGNNTRRTPVLKFSYSNCGQPSDPIQIQSLSVGPDPIKLPGDLLVSLDASTSVNVTEPFQVDMVIKKKVVLLWVEIPCVDQVGSCTYSDFCPMIQNLLNPCPAAFIKAKVPCSCPYSQGPYHLDKSIITLPSIPLPSWASSGDYHINLKASMSDKPLICIDVYLTLD